MSGLEVNVREVAKARHTDPMNTWPDHIRNHRATVPMGYLLHDSACLRCALEYEAANAARENKPIDTHVAGPKKEYSRP